jgi:hypothetical protein
MTDKEREALNRRLSQLQRLNSYQVPRSMLIFGAENLFVPISGGRTKAIWQIVRSGISWHWTTIKIASFRFYQMKVLRKTEREYLLAVGLDNEAIDELSETG